MLKRKCASDIGSVLIGNADWTFAVPNQGGDGTTRVRIYKDDAEFLADPWAKGMKFISSAQGRFYMYNYDCAYDALRRLEDVKPIAKFNGRYAVYSGLWKVAFVRWEKY